MPARAARSRRDGCRAAPRRAATCPAPAGRATPGPRPAREIPVSQPIQEPSDAERGPSAARGEDPAPSARTGVGSGPGAPPQAVPDPGCRSTRPHRPPAARDPRPGLLTALLLSLGVHAIAAGALAGLTLSGGGPASIDSPPVPIRIWLAPAAGGGVDGAADASGAPAAPGGAGAAQPEPEPDAELIVDAAPSEPVAPPPPAPAPAMQPAPATAPPPALAPLPDVARWLLEVQADPRDVVSTPACAAPLAPAPEAAPTAPPAPDSSAPVATTGEWEGPPAPAPLASASHGGRPPDIGLFGDGDGAGAGFGAAGGSAGHGGGEGGGVGTGVGPGPGGHEGGTGLLPVPLGGNVAPEYSLAARRAGEEGLVVIHAQVLADGSVADASVGESSGYERLDDAALAAVRSWRFQPALHDGEPVAQSVDVPIRFRLRGR